MIRDARNKRARTDVIPDAVTAISNARLLSDDDLSEPLTVLVRGERIVESGSPTTSIDAHGRTLLPGLIDAHVHLFRGRPDLDDLTDWGITTALDMGLWPAQSVTALRCAAAASDIRSATIPAVGPGSLAARQAGFPREGIVATAVQGRAFVRQRIAEGADYIKIITEAAPPAGLDQATADAIVEVAHNHNKHVVAHATTVGAFHVALRAGVDIITHAPLDCRLDEQSIATMVHNNVACVPTLAMMQHMAEDPGHRPEPNTHWSYQNAHQTVAALHEAGVSIAVGTDAHVIPNGPLTLKPGESIHREMELLARAGLSATEVLCSATHTSAQIFGLTDRGEIAAGKRADLVLIDGNPLHDLAATRNIVSVWIAGKQIR